MIVIEMAGAGSGGRNSEVLHWRGNAGNADIAALSDVASRDSDDKAKPESAGNGKHQTSSGFLSSPTTAASCLTFQTCR
jgi:hypothetical protein